VESAERGRIVARPRFGPKKAKGGPAAALADRPARIRPTGKEIVEAQIEGEILKRIMSRERWQQIEELLSIEGYEVIPDLFENTIRKRR